MGAAIVLQVTLVNCELSRGETERNNSCEESDFGYPCRRTLESWIVILSVYTWDELVPSVDYVGHFTDGIMISYVLRASKQILYSEC